MTEFPGTYVPVGLILWLFLLLYGVIKYSRRKRAVRAAEAFRDTVMSELKGLYPVPRRLEQEDCDRISNSVPAIERAAAGFRKYVPARDRKAFDAALQDYRKHCEKFTWVSCVTFNVMPGEGKPEDAGPKEIFRQRVNALLAFAKGREG